MTDERESDDPEGSARPSRDVFICLALTAAVGFALMLLGSACDVPSSSATDAHADAGAVDVTPAVQPYAVAQALVVAKPPGPINPGPIVVGSDDTAAICDWYYQRCVKGCGFSPFVFVCLDQCYRNWQFCVRPGP